MNCKNCNQVAKGNFCKHCGQSTKVARINLPNFLKEISSSIFQINKGLFFTLKELFVRPGHSIRDYLNGKRKNHFKPIAYAFMLSTIYFLVSRGLEGQTLLDMAFEGFWQYGDGIDIKQLAANNWFIKNYAYTILIFLPLYALASYLAFLRSGYNYLEHFVLNAFIVGQQAIFYSISTILSSLTNYDDFWLLVTLFISIAYTFYVFRQFFANKNRKLVIFLTIVVYLLVIILIALFSPLIISQRP